MPSPFTPPSKPVAKNDHLIPQEYTQVYLPTIDPRANTHYVEVQLLEATPSNVLKTELDPNNYLKVEDPIRTIESSVSILPGVMKAVKGTSTNRYNQIKDVISHSQSEPMYMNGRDNKLTIQPSKHLDPPYFKYTYGGGSGELLEVNIDTDYTQAIKEVSKNTDIDPSDKTINSTLTNTVSVDAAATQDGKTRLVTYSPTRNLNPVDALAMKPPLPNLPTSGLAKESNYEPDLSFTTNPDGSLNFDSTEKARTSAPIYDDLETAIEELRKTYRTNPEDLQKVIDDATKKISASNNPTSKEALGNYLGSLNSLFTVPYRRYIRLNREVNPITINNRFDKVKHMLRSTDNPSTSQANTKYNTQVLAQIWWDGFNDLKSDSKVEIIPKREGATKDDNWGYNVHDNVATYETTMVNMPISPARILAESDYSGLADSLATSMIKTITSKIKASIKIIGNPHLESAMNVDIQNISDRYSGVWYATSVSHNFSQDGYTCNVKLQQRSIPIFGTTMSNKQSLTNAFMSLNKIAKESMKTGTWVDNSKLYYKALELLKTPSMRGNYAIGEDDAGNIQVVESTGALRVDQDIAKTAIVAKENPTNPTMGDDGEDSDL